MESVSAEPTNDSCPTGSVINNIHPPSPAGPVAPDDAVEVHPSSVPPAGPAVHSIEATEVNPCPLPPTTPAGSSHVDETALHPPSPALTPPVVAGPSHIDETTVHSPNPFSATLDQFRQVPRDTIIINLTQWQDPDLFISPPQTCKVLRLVALTHRKYRISNFQHEILVMEVLNLDTR